jgi:2,4-dienoyl-CoA reductase-like NADH-dependent reductase (Old Yellow Enzyme family)
MSMRTEACFTAVVNVGLSVRASSAQLLAQLYHVGRTDSGYPRLAPTLHGPASPTPRPAREYPRELP